MKKVCLAILSLAIALCIGVTGVVAANAAETTSQNAAVPIMPLLNFINRTTTMIRVETNGRVTMTGSITGYNGLTTRVSITLHLEHRPNASSAWRTVASEPTRTFNSFTGTHQAVRTVTARGQYRTRAVYRAYAGTRVETLTAFSGIATF